MFILSYMDIESRSGELGGPNNGEVSIDVLDEILTGTADDPVTSIIEFTYPSILDNVGARLIMSLFCFNDEK